MPTSLASHDMVLYTIIGRTCVGCVYRGLHALYRTLSEICMISNIKRKVVSWQYRDMVIELDMRIPAVDPIKCITRMANLNQKVKQKAINIIDAATKSGLSTGKNPMGLAASIL